jgi:cation diffusion facilitator CzcD-associated flavoprotein CzcO
MANGYLQKPKLPGLEGISDFAGHTFHTSRWDYDYTGADLANLADKKVGIIGTGATAIQCVPHLAKAAKELLVFQRTPSTVDVRGNRPTDPDWSGSLQDGWQRRRIENFQLLTAGGEADEDLVDDAWTSIVKKLFVMRQTRVEGMSDEDRLRAVELADFAKMEEIRARVDSIVTDPATAEALKPWYGYFCKRPCFHDDYLQSFNRDNVTLVDTKGKGVERITSDGVVVDGTEHNIDCLIFATGFEVGTDYSRRTGFEIVGRDGVTITDKWQDGVQTLHGLAVNGFPNCFILSIAQSITARVRQRTNQYAIDDGEDRDRRANAERQRRDGHGSERRRFPQRARREAQVLKQSAHGRLDVGFRKSAVTVGCHACRRNAPISRCENPARCGRLPRRTSF